MVRRNTERIGLLAQFLNRPSSSDPDDTQQSIPDILPKLTNQVFRAVLRELGIHHVNCEREADMHVAELALYLNCPVVSNDSDFFIFAAPPTCDYRVIPLTFMEQECKPLPLRCNSCPVDRDCYAISCKVFRPSNSSLKRIHSSLVPLLPVLVGNDVISSMPLPTAIISCINSIQNLGLSYTGRRIHAIIDWLTEFSQDICAPIREILSLHQGKPLHDITSQIITCIQGYVLDLHTVCQQLCAFLSLKPPGQIEVPTLHFSADVSTLVRTALRPSNLDDAIAAIKNALPSECGRISETLHGGVLNGWPPGFIIKFRRSKLSTSILDALYVRNGAVLRILMEDLRLASSIYSVTEHIRVLEYGLLIHIERMFDGSHKICGSHSGNPVETKRRAGEMCRFELHAVPVTFPPIKSVGLAAFNEFFQRHLMFDLREAKSNSTELYTIACVLVLWFRHSQLSRFMSSGLRDSSVVLAFVSCALVASAFLCSSHDQRNNLDRSVEDICNRFTELGNSLKFQCSRFRCVRLSIEIIHQLNELQLVYQEFQNLIELLNMLYVHSVANIQSGSSRLSSEQFFSFLPEYIMFPSGRVLHWLTYVIDRSSPPDRLHHVTRNWIPWILNAMPREMSISPKSISHKIVESISTAERMLSW